MSYTVKKSCLICTKKKTKSLIERPNIYNIWQIRDRSTKLALAS